MPSRNVIIVVILSLITIPSSILVYFSRHGHVHLKLLADSYNLTSSKNEERIKYSAC